MVKFTCAARHLCGMNNPQVTDANPQHHCANCRKAMCGGLCGNQLAVQSDEYFIPIENLSEEGRQLYNSDTALICKICIEKCSIPKKPSTVTIDSSHCVSIYLSGVFGQ